MGNAGEQLVGSCIKKLKTGIREEVQVVLLLHIIKPKLFNKYKRSQHPITNCEGVNHLADLWHLHYNSAEGRKKFDRKSFHWNTVKKNICIIEKARGWGILLFKEWMKIEENVWTLIKVSEKLKLFSILLISNHIITD